MESKWRKLGKGVEDEEERKEKEVPGRRALIMGWEGMVAGLFPVPALIICGDGKHAWAEAVAVFAFQE